MTKAQLLDIGLNFAIIILLTTEILHQARMVVATAGERPTVAVDVSFDTEGTAVLSAVGSSGTLQQMRSKFVALCARRVPPVLALHFTDPVSTLHRQAQAVAAELSSVAAIACSVSY